MYSYIYSKIKKKLQSKNHENPNIKKYQNFYPNKNSINLGYCLSISLTCYLIYLIYLKFDVNFPDNLNTLSHRQNTDQQLTLDFTTRRLKLPLDKE